VKKILPAGVSRQLSKTILKTKRNSPHILFGAGLGGAAVATVMACKATLQAEPMLDQIKNEVEATKERGPYASQKEETRAVALVYAKGAGHIVHVYAPAIIIGGLSVAALTGSHVQLTRRNTALKGTLAATMLAFSEYRGRVREVLGEEKEKDLFNGLESQTIKHPDGTKELVKIRTRPGLSLYAKQFDRTNPKWQKNSEMNRAFIQIQQDIANHDLNARGYVFLNDVYEALGFERTKAGQHVGWVRNGDGDGYIDFGLQEIHNAGLVDGTNKEAWLDFNVDGVIENLLEEF
jgi:hypothetical protein